MTTTSDGSAASDPARPPAPGEVDGVRPLTSVLGGAAFVSLATVRRSGDAVATPVWVVRDGDELLVLTPADSGKVRRLRHDARVALRPCGRRGRVAPGVLPVPGRAVVDDSPAAVGRALALLRAKHGGEVSLVLGVERVLARGVKPRVVLRITLD